MPENREISEIWRALNEISKILAVLEKRMTNLEKKVYVYKGYSDVETGDMK